MEEDDEDEFDFGRAKMDFFKKRAREILTADADLEYEGNPMPLGGAYKNLKHAIKNPAIVYTKLENKPNYMKMTFSMGRQAPAGGRFMDLSKKNSITSSVQNLSSNMSGQALNPLLLSMKQKSSMGAYQDPKKENTFLKQVFGASKAKSEKEAKIDSKVEALLKAYKQ